MDRRRARHSLGNGSPCRGLCHCARRASHCDARRRRDAVADGRDPWERERTQRRTAIRIRTRAARSGGVDRPLSFSSADWCDDRRAGRAERRNRFHSASTTGRTALDAHRYASGLGLRDPVGLRAHRNARQPGDRIPDVRPRSAAASCCGVSAMDDRHRLVGSRGRMGAVTADGDAGCRVNRMSGHRAASCLGLAMVALLPLPLHAHSGPPFPIVSDQTAGAYSISIWTDPDTTDNGTAGGQFWVMIAPLHRSSATPADTRATVLAAPLDRTGEATSAAAAPVRGDPSTQFAAVVLDHEGRFRVEIAIDGPLGRAMVDAEVAATYDLRPPPLMILVYLMPFVLVGLLWTAVLVRRRRAVAPGSPGVRRGAAGES